MKKYTYILLCLFSTQFIFAQKIDCENIIKFLYEKEEEISYLNLRDPDFIPLHCFIAKDIIIELEQFKNETILYLETCPLISFREIINKYDELINSVQIKYDSLHWLSNHVYFLFFEKALLEYQLRNEEDAAYFLDRSLQYFPTFPDAILLKLNKLLVQNKFNDCLSLLNTLYYETDLDEAQEQQAIEFTDNFYDKLYRTGDSLVRIEHAAEALELFQILEVFCQNLPSAYCNDDYYHGVLRSKTGIYDSYLAIAKVASKRGNIDIANRFYQYAQVYLETNPHLANYKPVVIETSVAEIRKQKAESNLEYEDVSQKQPSINRRLQPAVTHPAEMEEKAGIEDAPGTSVVAIKEKYDTLVIKALTLCIKDEFSASYKLFLEAKKLEDCRCFDSDFRVDLMISELTKIID